MTDCMRLEERRRSKLSIETLRRELREADHERFRMVAALNAAADTWLVPKSSPSPVRSSPVLAILTSSGLCLLLIGGVVWERLGFGFNRGDRVAIASAPEPRIPVPADSAARPIRTVPVRAIDSASPRGVAGVDPARASRRRPIAPRPRPLSPGEFGRAPRDPSR